ncbi:hypothetical protein [Agrobacterium tumefaciens]|uniref:hypothetical protein n=1 Tax=Agrobacterium tumefaciens TaxID=358 RepID=UPI003CE4801D
MPVETKTTCPYCGVGCGVIATVADDGIVSVKGDPDHPANFGRLCSKGSALAETIDLDGRLLHPEIHGKAGGMGRSASISSPPGFPRPSPSTARIRLPFTSPANC